jgi:pyruvate,water dikinase
MKENIFIKQLNQVGLAEVETAGGKNTSPGEMIRHLSGLEINIPDGFIITVSWIQAVYLK